MKEIKEKIIEILKKIIIKNIKGRGAYTITLYEGLYEELANQILELFEEEKQKWLKEKTDTNIKSQSTYSCDHEWVMDNSTSSVWQCIKCGLTQPRPII